jgi:type VII secretion protein EccB
MQSALLVADPDRPEPPQRRAGLAIFAGIMISIVVVAGVGIFGLVKKGGKDSWRNESVISVEKETGTRYVYLDGVLHPVLNYASARLILNQADVRVDHLSQASLADAPRGVTLGLEGLPDSLPSEDHLTSGPWSVCSSAAGETSTVAVGIAPGSDELGENEALLVRTPDDAYHLVWRNTRMWIPNLNTVRAAFNYDPGHAIPVSGAWANSVRAGPDLTVRRIPGFGELASYAVGDQGTVRVGQLFQTDAGTDVGSRYYIAARDGLALVPTTAGQLMLADQQMDPSGGHNPRSIRVSTSAVGAAPRSGVSVFDAGLPRESGQMTQVLADRESAALCSSYRVNPENTFTTSVHLTTAADLPRATTQGWTVEGEKVNAVVAPGKGAVVRNLPHDGRPGQSWFVVTDLGAKFQVLPGHNSVEHVLEILGFGGVTAAPVPDGILALLPSGPALDQTTVNVTHPVTGT